MGFQKTCQYHSISRPTSSFTKHGVLGAAEIKPKLGTAISIPESASAVRAPKVPESKNEAFLGFRWYGVMEIMLLE